MTISRYDTRVDLILLDIVDFNFILNMDWLSPHHTILACFSKIVTLYITSIPLIMLIGATSHILSGIDFFSSGLSG